METLGQFLQQAREGKDLRLEDIAQRTRINLRYLEALEADQFEKLPSEVMARGFARSYAMSLGLNEKEVLALFDESAKSFFRKKEEARHRLEEQQQKIKSREVLRSYLGRLNIVLVIGIALALLYWINSGRVENPAPQSDSTDQSAAVTLPEQETPAQDLPQKPMVADKGPAVNKPALREEQSVSIDTGQIGTETTEASVAGLPPESVNEARVQNESIPTEPKVPVLESPPTPIRDVFMVNKPSVREESAPPVSSAEPPPLTLSIEAVEAGWVAARIDDAVTKEVFLEPGEKVRWVAAERFVLSLGNAGGVKIELNGKPLKPLGPRGAVVKDIPLTHDYPHSILPM
jgi:cytoskeletal protein RodZ